MTLPEKVTSLTHPTIVQTIGKRYVIYSGGGNGGWFEVDDKFTIEDALSRWEPLQVGPKEEKPTTSTTWQVPNSKKNGFYAVTSDITGWKCNCQGYSYRRDCRHIQETKAKLN